MLKNDLLKVEIIEILSQIRPGLRVVSEESLFGFKNALDSRDVAYLLLELEERHGISVQKLVDVIESKTGEYSVNEIAELVSPLLEIV